MLAIELLHLPDKPAGVERAAIYKLAVLEGTFVH